jgi:class 3 adenylate cyclase
METKNVCLVYADISGYTRFIKFHHTSLLHAEQIITELLETIIDAAEYPLQVNKLEGDAALLYAEVPVHEESRATKDVAAQIDRLFKAFKSKERALVACDNGCVCEACRQIGELKLKAVLHMGQASLRRIRHLEELAGLDVNLVRDLLQQSQVTVPEYVLMTESFYRASGGLPGQTAEARLEDGGVAGHLPVWVYYPDSEVVDVPRESAAAFSGRLNQHAFARMLTGKPQATFNHLPQGSSNIFFYLGEGIFSGLNVLRKWIRKPYGN